MRNTSSKKKKPVEFDQAINYVMKIKTRFSDQIETYQTFLQILHTYQRERKSLKSLKCVYEQIAQLFRDQPDLLDEFSMFLPKGVYGHPARMARWRLLGRMAGSLMLAWRRASERAYAPGGSGFEVCRDEFVAISGGVDRGESNRIEKMTTQPPPKRAKIDTDIKQPTEDVSAIDGKESVTTGA